MYQIVSRKKMFAVLISFFLLVSTVAFTAFGQTVPTGIDHNEIKIPIIMYHGLCKDSNRRNEYMISPEYFEQDLKYIADQGYTAIFLSELIDYFEKGTPLPDKPIILTFDDGYYNNYVYAYPLLQKYKIKAVISPIGITADNAENEQYRSPLWSQCKWSELKEMQDSGLVEIQNHTYNLHKLSSSAKGVSAMQGESTQEYKERLSHDLLTFNAKMKTELGTNPLAFVYPFGVKSTDTEQIIRSLGFKAILDCENKMNIITSKDDLYHLHRFLRPDNLNASDFFSKYES